MKRLLVVCLAVAAAFAASPGDARAGQCGLPGRGTLWIDFADGSVPFWPLFAKPGVIGAASNLLFPPQLRAAGAKTVYWDMYLNNRVGTPAKPADPAVIEDRANRIFYRAVASSGCPTPWMALNELFGASTTTPWTPNNAQYRANVLTFVRALAARGARPFLLVPTKAYAADEAGAWWREVARYAEIVREVYFPAPQIHRLGPVVGSRRMRMAFRAGIREYTDMGIPPSRLGIFVGFHTGRGQGGREGLERTAWFRHAKLQALAVRQVARELRFHTIWSWGWASWGGKEADPDKEIAACVYLWTRDARLCNGPARAGPRFNPDRTEGQINLPRGVQCRIGGIRIGSGEIGRLARVIGDRQAAFTALAARAVASNEMPLREADVLAAERSLVRFRFGGSRAAYRGALSRAGLTVAMARGVIGDELRQSELERYLRVRPPSGGDIGDYYRTYAGAQARAVRVKPAAWWLGGARSGVALDSLAPAQVFRLPSGKPTKVHTHTGTYTVTALGKPMPLGTFALARARSSIRAAIVRTMRGEAFQRWLLRRAKARFDGAVCRRDELPAPGAVDLTNYVPFLELTM